MTECKRCLLGTDILGITLNDDGICDYCVLHDELEKKHPVSNKRLKKCFTDILKDTAGEKYNCIIGISGGADSSYMLHLAVKYGLNPLCVHYDNGWDATTAKSNMLKMTDALSVDVIYVKANEIYHKINKAFLEANVSDADIPNDVALLSVVIDTARTYNIKYNLSGHNFRTEGSCPICWTFMNTQYIKDVYNWYWKEELEGYPDYSLWQQFKWGIKNNIKTVRPLYYINKTDAEIREFLRKKYDWKDYGGKHCENLYTEFIGTIILLKCMEIDKRLLYLSAKIRSGHITKKEARKELKTELHTDAYDLFDIYEKYYGKMDGEHLDVKEQHFWDFGDYLMPYTKFKWLLKIGVRLGIFPLTFYEKYTRESIAIEKHIKDSRR